MYGKQHRTRQRKGRSLDFDCAPTKAAAWLWHLRSSSVRVAADQYYGNPDLVFNGGNEAMDRGGEIMVNDRVVRHLRHGQRTRSNHRSREHSRFWQESRASSTSFYEGNCNNIGGSQRWDCGSDLYDAFELVSVSKRIDSSIMRSVIIDATKPADIDGDIDWNLTYPPSHVQADFKFPAVADSRSNIPSPVQNRGNHRLHLDRNRSERRLSDPIRRIIQKLINVPDEHSDDSLRAPTAPAMESTRRSSQRRTWERRFRAIINGSTWRRLFAINSFSKNTDR